MKFDISSLNDTGGRKYNEDSIYSHQRANSVLCVVADGLGMHGNGDEASKLAVEIIAKNLDNLDKMSKEKILDVMVMANDEIIKNQTPSCKMKSTAVMLCINSKEIFSAHIGDSRLYCFKRNKIIHQTVDHSVSQMAVFRGEITISQIRFHEDRNRLLAALGSENPKPTIDKLEFEIETGDAFLLCTDGFWEYVTENEMEIDLTKSENANTWLSFMLSRIINRVDGKNDNLSAICVLVN